MRSFPSLMVVAALLGGCEAGAPGAAGPGGWLEGDRGQQLDTLAAQLRGLDVAMWETGYRYTELYFAGADGNWPYARYQAEKLALTLEQALVRRPERARSAQPYLDTALPAVQRAAQAGDQGAFNRAFEQLTAACNTCHEAEDVASFTVRPPRARLSPVRP